ncbi:substrate-binding periplasmic protein [Motiliproteus sediminis]|uniref:substrate-binding periplasmic protein n=1 Tax=Motiliproteus sediminis TaxID=1468178 RepID=UPI001AEFC0AE|nr:transporter substrate-binding domain-containing protein [Motiliproteus sediminis]
MKMAKNLMRLAAILLLGVSGTAWAQTVNLYTYHLSPPFVSGKGAGLTYDLATYLSEKSAGKYQFQVQELPRKRLNEVIKSDDAGVVPWVMPAWFQDKEETSYLWTQGFFPDGNALLSPASAKIEYNGEITSLHGLKFGGVRGHKYQDIDAAVEAGNISRQDAQDIDANLRKLAAGRIDFSSAADSASRYLVAEMGLSSKIHFSSTPHTQYNRRFLVMKALPEVKAFLSQVVAEMPTDEKWAAIVSQYQ